MDPRRQAALVARLERLAAHRPLAYRTRVLLLALLGYGYIVGVLALALALAGGIAWTIATSRSALGAAKLLLPLGALVWVVARALWVRLDPPSGRLLRLDEAPLLHDAIERVRRRLGAPPVHATLLTADLNASVSQVPRIGVFGWPRNYLTVGLPLLGALTPAQLDAVLAHEFAHLSHRHARFGNHIWRLARTWTQLLDTLQRERSWGARVFERFFAWYAPYFGVYTAVLSRQAEHEADRLAASAGVGEAAMADTLIALELAGRFLDEAYWPAVLRAAHHQPLPPDAVFSDMLRAVREVRTQPAAVHWLEDALAARTHDGASHPALADRLKALGATAPSLTPGSHWPSLGDGSAAGRLLGEEAATLARELDVDWRRSVGPSWRDHHQALREASERRDQLARRAREGELTVDETWTLARETLELDGEDLALPLLHEVLSRDPGHAAARFSLGRVLLGRDDDDGLRHLDVAMENDTEAVLPGCELADAFLTSHGRAREAMAYRERAHAHQRFLERVARERETVSARDTLVPATLPAADVESVRAALASHGDVRRGWIARKVTSLQPERPLIVVGVERRAPWYQPRRADADRALLGELLTRITPETPCDLYVVILDGDARALKKRLRGVGDALVFERG